MNINIKKSFSKDLKKIHDKKLLTDIYKILEQMQHAQSIKEIKHMKKMEGSKNHYRIKLGDYRFGLYINEDKTIFIVRFLHRKEIYRYFP